MSFYKLIKASEQELNHAKLEAVIDVIRNSEAIDNEDFELAFERRLKKTQENPEP